MIAAIVWMGVGAIVVLFTMALCQAASGGTGWPMRQWKKEEGGSGSPDRRWGIRSEEKGPRRKDKGK